MEKEGMKVLMVNRSDTSGGAARAASRLHCALNLHGLHSRMLVQSKLGNDARVIGSNSWFSRVIDRMRPIMDKLPVYLYPNRERRIFSNAIVPTKTAEKINSINPDIVHLHWIGGGFMNIESVKNIKRPILWTLHDSWAFTGGCHVPFECERYRLQCGNCQQLGSKNEHDLSSWNWKRKMLAWNNLNMTIVAPSEWLMSCAKNSLLLRNKNIITIPNGLDTEIFIPINKNEARNKMKLPVKKKLVLFGAMNALTDRNKGFDYLKMAINEMSLMRQSNELEMIIFGASEKDLSGLNLGIKIHCFGHLNDDDKLAFLYSAADVTVVPSVQESFGQTASESLSCGTPVVAFDVTGLKDVVNHMENGYLAKPFDVGDLAKGIEWCISDEQRHLNLVSNARKKAVSSFDIKLTSKKYIDIYEKILSNNV